MGKSVSCRQVSFFACLFLVLLRMSIGWQFVYEGMWKRDTLTTDRPWTAEGYLGAASGPFRDHFRNLLDDPNGFDRLDYDKVTQTWDNWANQFKEAYGLDAVQKANLDAVLNSESEYTFPLDKLPDGVDLSKVKLPKGQSVRFDAEKRLLVATTHLLPAERDAMKKLADAPPPPPKETTAAKPDVKPEVKPEAKPDGNKTDEKSEKKDEKSDGKKADDVKKVDDKKPVDPKPEETPKAPVEDKDRQEIVAKYKSAVDGLYGRSSSKLGLKERLRLLLVETPDPDKSAKDRKEPSAEVKEETSRSEAVIAANDLQDPKIDPQRPSNLLLYRKLVNRYEESLKMKPGSYERKLIEPQRKDMLKKRTELVAPVDALSSELVSAAYKDITPDQMKNVKAPPTPFKAKIAETNQRTIWALLIIGGLMMAGLFTRLSSLAGAGLLLMFYLTLPPWPWVPGAEEAGGTEHALIVNKNFIEFLACLALAFLPSGRWFGVDSLIHRLIFPQRDR